MLAVQTVKVFIQLAHFSLKWQIFIRSPYYYNQHKQ